MYARMCAGMCEPVRMHIYIYDVSACAMCICMRVRSAYRPMCMYNYVQTVRLLCMYYVRIHSFICKYVRVLSVCVYVLSMYVCKYRPYFVKRGQNTKYQFYRRSKKVAPFYI
jgi:hypothetical protein